MARGTPILTSWTSGELSPLMMGRVDHKRYFTGAQILENFLSTPQGPLTRRPGTRFIAAAKYGDREAILADFEFNEEQAYQLEIGDLYMRFFMNRGRIEPANTAAAIANGDFPADLSSWTASSVTWSAGAALFAAGGTLRQQINGTADVATVLHFKVDGIPGRDKLKFRVGTAAGGEQIMADKEFNVGWHTITFTPTAATFHLQFAQSNGTPKLDNVRFISAAALELETPLAAGTLRDFLQWVQSNDVMFLTHPDYWSMTLTRSGHTSWSLERFDFIDGPYLDENAGDTTLTPSATTGEITVTASAVTGINGGRGFLATDIGRNIRIKQGSDWGWGRIIARASTTSVTVQVRKDLGGTAAVKTWRLGLYSDTTGWPRTPTFHEERFCLAGAAERPQRIDGSKTGDFYTFAPGTNDADPFAYNVGSNKLNLITWLSSTSALVGGTPGGALVARTDAVNAPITPTNANVKFHTRLGANTVRALELDAVVYTHRHGRQVFAFDYAVDKDRFAPVHLTDFAEHVTESGIVGMAYQQQPFPIIWCPRADGILIGCTYRPEHEVIGWHRHPLGGDGRAESVSVIPGDGTDEVWLLVAREIDGAEVRYIEMLEEQFSVEKRQDEAFFVDCGLSLVNWQNVTLTPAAVSGNGVTFNAGGAVFSAGDIGREIHLDYVKTELVVTANNPRGYVKKTKTKARARIVSYVGPTEVTADILRAFPSADPIAAGEWRLTVSTVTGLDHLEGMTVQALSDGAVNSEKVVTGGEIELDFPGSRVHVGLGYLSQMLSMPIEAGQAEGTAQGKQQRISELNIRFTRSIGGAAGRDADTLTTINWMTASDLMDEPPPLFTGIKKVAEFPSGWQTGATALVAQQDPCPMTINAIIPTVTTSG